MIARVTLLLPFDLVIREGDELPSLDFRREAETVTFHPLRYAAERADLLLGSILSNVAALKSIRPAEFTDVFLADQKRTARVNVLTMDFRRPDFDRTSKTECDPTTTTVNDVANWLLARIRVYSRAFQIRPIDVARTPFHIQYLTDEGQTLKQEKEKGRGWFGGTSTIGAAPITPDAFALVLNRQESTEPYTWDELLLDARALLPEVGGAVVLANAAVETFIGWALDVLHDAQPLPDGLWQWIKKRDHWSKEPSVAEEFDVLLRILGGRSLKEAEPALWQKFRELRDARNKVAHEGKAIIGKKPVDSEKAQSLVEDADTIIKWVEALLPERWRRARTDAQGPFSRRFATPEEAVDLGFATKPPDTDASEEELTNADATREARLPEDGLGVSAVSPVKGEAGRVLGDSSAPAEQGPKPPRKRIQGATKKHGRKTPSKNK